MALARTLDCVSNKLIEISGTLRSNAQKIRDNVDECKNRKDALQNILVTDVTTDPEQRNNITRSGLATLLPTSEEPSIYNYGFLSDDSSDEQVDDTSENTQKKKKRKIKTTPKQPGNPDTRFVDVKQNLNISANFVCKVADCGKKFRDSSELNNHMSMHQEDFFICMKCSQIFRSSYSFQRHHDTHTGKAHICKVCKQQFDLKTTLTNHLQKHSSTPAVVCNVCRKAFQYRQRGIEHVKWFHRATKDVLCPICKKAYQMPSYMRVHKSRRHGSVSQLVHPTV